MNEKRLFKALSQLREGSNSLVPEIITRLKSLDGPSMSHQRLYAIGCSMVQNHGRLLVYAPTCPDYTHQNGVYTFKGLAGSVPLLAQKHATFIHSIPHDEVVIVIADMERFDKALCQKVGRSEVEFLACLQSTRAELSTARPDWQVIFMSELIPDFLGEEQVVVNQIHADVGVSQRLQTDTLTRMSMYRRIKADISIQEAVERTVRTAAQYAVLGRWAAASGVVLVNHVTTSLSWYDYLVSGSAPVIHNPVTIY